MRVNHLLTTAGAAQHKKAENLNEEMDKKDDNRATSVQWCWHWKRGHWRAEDAPSVDVKEKIKKVASMKKKRSSKEVDAAAKAVYLVCIFMKFLLISNKERACLFKKS